MIASLITRFLPTFAPALLNPWVLLGIVAYTVGVAGFSGLQGYRLGMNEYYEYVAEQATETVKFITKVVTLKEEVRVPYVKKEVEIRTVYQTIEKEVDHVPNRDSCNVTVGWMRYHNAAAEASDRRLEGGVDDKTDTGIGEATAAAVVGRNYKRFYQVANDLKACRAFVNGLDRITAE